MMGVVLNRLATTNTGFQHAFIMITDTQIYQTWPSNPIIQYPVPLPEDTLSSTHKGSL